MLDGDPVQYAGMARLQSWPWLAKAACMVCLPCVALPQFAWHAASLPAQCSVMYSAETQDGFHATDLVFLGAILSAEGMLT